MGEKGETKAPTEPSSREASGGIEKSSKERGTFRRWGKNQKKVGRGKAPRPAKKKKNNRWKPKKKGRGLRGGKCFRWASLLKKKSPQATLLRERLVKGKPKQELGGGEKKTLDCPRFELEGSC